jgi:hypothetical protein
MHRLQKFGIKPDGIINFLSNEPPFELTQRLRYLAACRAEAHLFSPFSPQIASFRGKNPPLVAGKNNVSVCRNKTTVGKNASAVGENPPRKTAQIHGNKVSVREEVPMA